MLDVICGSHRGGFPLAKLLKLVYQLESKLQCSHCSLNITIVKNFPKQNLLSLESYFPMLYIKAFCRQFNFAFGLPTHTHPSLYIYDSDCCCGNSLMPHSQQTIQSQENALLKPTLWLFMGSVDEKSNAKD